MMKVSLLHHILLLAPNVNAFQINLLGSSSSLQQPLYYASSATVSGKIVQHSSSGVSDHREELESKVMSMKPEQIKSLLLELLPKMTGSAEEFHLVEVYINALEDKFQHPQTLGFFNMALAGDWQFLFTTNQLQRPNRKLRLSEVLQKINTNELKGNMTNEVRWDLAEDGSVFDAFGTFSYKTAYVMKQGARMTIDVDHDMSLVLSKGSQLPKDAQGLVALIRTAMPAEMFDASGSVMDTTYLDADIRIVRFDGSGHQGVRNIFMKKGAMQLYPEVKKQPYC